MPIISTSYLLATLATQAASAFFNAKRGKKHSAELAKKQQEYEERVLKEGIENARAEFAEMCALQRGLELEMQHDRLQMIRDSLNSNIMLEAYRYSLKDWPLLVPPFVIKNEYLPVLEFEENEQNYTIPVNCIMTTSTDRRFNLSVFALLEERLAQFFSKYWKADGDKSIRFYQQAWRNNVTDIGSKMHDIKAHLSEVPTIVLSPIFDDNKLKFAFSWWGMSKNIEDEHIVEPDNVFDPELSIEVRPGMDYDEKTIEIIVDETFNKLAAFISYFADLYYWNFYKIAPSLPVLIGNDMIMLSKNDKQSYKDEYQNQLLEYCKEQDCIINPAVVSEQLFVSMSNIVDKSTIAKGIIDYIETKRNNDVLNCCELRLLNTIKEIVVDEIQEVSFAISYIENNEEIGYFPCAGKNDLLQTLYNYCEKYNAKYADLNTINKNSSYIQFYNDKNELIVDPMGYRSYIAIYPEWELEGENQFDFESCRINRTSFSCKDLRLNGDLLENVAFLYEEQRMFVEALSVSCEKILSEKKLNKLELIDIAYDDIKNIIERLCQNHKTISNKDSAYIIIGYSKEDDNYLCLINLMANNSFIGAGFVCRSNSLDKKLIRKMNKKTILKIRINE